MSEHPDPSPPAKPEPEVTDTDPAQPPTGPSRSAEQTARAARLASALRDNLRRRKGLKRPPAANGN